MTMTVSWKETDSERTDQEVRSDDNEPLEGSAQTIRKPSGIDESSRDMAVLLKASVIESSRDKL